jgi:hypothetical protein
MMQPFNDAIVRMVPDIRAALVPKLDFAIFQPQMLNIIGDVNKRLASSVVFDMKAFQEALAPLRTLKLKLPAIDRERLLALIDSMEDDEEAAKAVAAPLDRETAEQLLWVLLVLLTAVLVGASAGAAAADYWLGKIAVELMSTIWLVVEVVKRTPE